MVEEPTRLRPRRPGTRRPSSRQSRWIFLWLTAQPHRGRRDTRTGTPSGASSRTHGASHATLDPESPSCRPGAGIDTRICSAQPGNTPSARSPTASRSNEPRQRSVRPGLEVSLSQLLQNRLLQLRLSEQPLQHGVLPLKLLHPLRVISLETAILIPPPIVRLLRHTKLTTHTHDLPTTGEHPRLTRNRAEDIARCPSTGEHPVRLPKLADNLLRDMPLPAVRHDLTSLPTHNRERQNDSHNNWTHNMRSGHLTHTT